MPRRDPRRRSSRPIRPPEPSSWLRIGPAVTGPTPGTWAGVDGAALGRRQVHLLVAQVSNGSCQPVHGIDPATAAPLGSTFKLYVLDALANAVAAGKVSWNQQLAVTSQVRGLPPGRAADRAGRHPGLGAGHRRQDDLPQRQHHR